MNDPIQGKKPPGVKLWVRRGAERERRRIRQNAEAFRSHRTPPKPLVLANEPTGPRATSSNASRGSNDQAANRGDINSAVHDRCCLADPDQTTASGNGAERHRLPKATRRAPPAGAGNRR